MEKYFGEKQERFSFRKLSVGLVSATISSLFFMSVLASSSVDAQETAGVHYKYVADSELSSEEKKQLVYDIPTYVENDDETYYLVYKLNSQNQLAELPNTGSKNERQALVAGASLAALGILIFAVSKKKVKNKTVLHLVLVAGIGNGVLVSVHALENHLLLNYNTDYELTSGEKLPLPKEISGYTYIGYIKEGKTTSDFEVSNQEKSAATPTKQQKVDYNVTPNFVDHPSTVQAIQEQTPVSSTKPTEVQVVEKPFSTELINPRKEEKQSSDSQEQLAEHKNLETKKEEKISPKEKTGVNTLNPQDEVLSGQLNKPELLYREETIETKIDFQEEIQENPDLAEGTVRVKQEGKLGKKVEIVRIFSVNKEEVSREIVSTSTTAPSPRIVEKGTKKTQVIKEQPETGVEHKDVQSGAIVEPAVQPALPEAVVSDKGVPEVQPELPEAVVSDKGVPEVQPELPEAVVSDKGEPEQVAPLPEYKGNIEQVKPETPVEKLQEEEPEKTIELRSVSDVELYSYEANQSKQHTILDKVPDNKSAYFIKVKSAKFKDVLLPVSNIEDTTKDGKVVYKITARLEHLKQSVDNQYQDNFTYYLPKVVQNDGPIYTSFKKLVTDMNSRPDGTFILGATMNAREFELGENQESYVTKNFTGTLIGSHQGKHYAIYNLKKPLFNTLNNAAIQDLTLKDVNISGKNHVASVAMEATNSSTLDNVHANGIIAGELGIGGLVQKVDNSTVRNSSFTGRITNTFVTTSQYAIGGLVGQLTGANARVAHSISTVVISSNGEHSNQTIGGIVGIVENNATVENSYAEGEINNAKPFARVGGVAGSLWTQEGGTDNNTGRLTNVLSDMNITNGNAISGYHFNGIKETNVYSNKENKVVNVQAVGDEVMSVDSTVERGTEIEKTSVQAKKDEITKKHTITVEDFTNSVKQDVDYTKAAHYQSTREVAYKNIEKLLPFYNRDTIVKYGNQLSTDHNLFKKELLSVVAMKNDEVVSDITSNKNSINHLLLHYKDGTSEKVDLTYNSDFANLAEYNIENTGLVYTPNAFLKNYTPIIDRVKNDLTAVPYNPTALKNLLGISDNVKLTELYLDEQFTKTKEHLTETLKKLLSADAAVSGNNDIIDNYIVDKIKRNKEALMLGLTYLERWYDFKFDKASAKDLLMFHMDFFGKGNTSPLDAIIELGKSGYNNLLAKNNVVTYNALLTNNYGTKDLFSALEGYRKAFAPHQTNNEWFKSQTKAYIVEEKSNIEEVKTKQGLVDTKYSIGVYDRITSATWKYRNMVLPLLTLPEKSVFVISTISSLGFGAYDRYRNSEHKAGKDLNDFVEENARETAKRQRDHYDYWYRILDDNAREKLYRNILLYDAYKFGDDNTVGKATEVADFDNPNPAMQHFFGPVGNKVGHNQHGAYATGDAVYYMGYRMLDKDGAITYTHEMTHDSDQDIYLGGYGRRSGLGPEFFAKGLLQAPDHPDDATITINSILKHSKSDSTESRRLQVLDPTTRFNNADDLKQYVHNMFDVVYMLEYLEGNSILKLDTNQKQQLLRKVTNEYHPDPDGNKVYATNVVRNITVEEVERLRSFNDLIDNNILSSREYASGKYERNGYFTIKLFAPIYAALSNDDGTPGDLMGRRMAYELLAAKGFKDGMVPYISNQFEADARANNKTITSYGKTKGLVTDTLVLQKLFNGQYNTWSDFKKAMYKERQDKFNKLNKISFKDPSQPWTRNIIKTIHSVNELQNLMNEAVRKDTETPHWYNYNPEIDSAVHKLKRAIFKAYLDQTNDFRSSIFENKK
ncbi:ZmpA/ZmpB/ZmpC family metallo-endopeptidase [Streptococcus pneumoniae]|uniref:ZmpA/ZmpB/ZmpC family metallo-endopeptidase n=1 Tax=Streptococcus pneumoniae TaxID=1313 RepID=UPI0005E728FD|nr:ZmpA/ZmpB/ZmpC family metallo-endopeptidase [Streptococcus pneumoniae]CEW30295.1 immunoglobulin A1 protease [Streptococcus pneumoniae]CGE78845.1 immunoglobulin A1 protease [Streptococcus pneumoniae]CIP14421.1 immunoglobulin A1 protease [Streptococcus pneumoniae]COG42102.1 immunoglobulin A1 protease [Streptococcus pneumoniae]COK36559.1 immunoglobulin A1 protease [Streptococcus pneumoniae]